MFNKLLTHLKKIDWIIFGCIILLIGFGLAVIYSVALSGGEAGFINFKKQCVFAVVGIALLFIFSFFDFHALYGFNKWIYAGGIGSLILVLLFGETVRGTRAWFEFGGFSLQPSELVKIVVVLALAKYFSAASYKINQLKHIILTGLIVFLPIILILWQPDFGSATIIFIFWLAILAIFGLNRKQIIIITFISLMLFATSFFFLLKDYQKERILTFLNPNISSLEQGYNVAQAIIAIGSGGLFGKGLGFGSQSQLKFLPESQTDFIFAVIGEELGLLGVIFLTTFFAVLFFRMLYWVRHLNNNFGLYIILGAIILFFVQMFINIGMNIGILPVVGIPLPFVSYGGSSLIASLVLVGIAESVIIHTRHN
ncbi:rod shape-determining protein RodA [Candidatus Falkowbacteria bacterium CG10_big_fil_rev_8_21_14_0_10_43_10]|uniref:Rod shape-determining protein RodA n=1 Tax=Candidatus Falkowbacteria bacterium CG10_big_fil_rev_8_21_14_0_10_43_10 TaxID=1974567 RepID=A0A2H0V2J0_9BACT|nr:MAG: rod shape-determining protein RodA [Candidatus Falkowbacteria bacterium CG10_big_fil_rev_8_21_14_0_10_43_10]